MIDVELLVLGGTRFVGRAVVDEALARGWGVTALHRGVSGSPLPPAVRVIRADRTDHRALAAAVEGGEWDHVVDTWSGAPRVATEAAQVLAGRVGRYALISSVSVYVWGRHVDESSPLVDGDPDADDADDAEDDADYAAAKRGAEIGVVRAFPDALLARAGLILGPREDIGRLPWWLRRIAAGGRVVAPGHPDRPLQYVDVRDLAAWTLAAPEGGVAGAVDVTGPSGHATTATFLDACRRATRSDAELVWIDDGRLEAAGVQPWIHLPCWVPPRGEFAGFLESDVSRALATGLRPRPVEQTVADTWSWMQAEAALPPPARIPAHGLPPEVERRVLGD